MNTNPKRPSRRRLRRFIFVIVGLVGLTMIPYLYFRLTSHRRLIMVHSPTPSSPIESQPDRAELSTITVATWNIAHGRGNTDSNLQEGGDAKKGRIKKIAKMIQSFDADFVVLNEVDFSATWSGGQNQAKAIAQSAGFPYYATQSNLDFGFIYGRWFFGNVVLSRHPIGDARPIDLPGLNRWEPWLVGKKRGLQCTIHLPDSQTATLIALHLESRGESIRIQQADRIIEAVQSATAPVLIAGDLNTTPLDAPHAARNELGINAFEKIIAGTGLKYTDNISIGQPTQSPPAEFSQLTFPAASPNRVIDWVLWDREHFRRIDHRVIKTELSDHLPVIATFTIPTQ